MYQFVVTCTIAHQLYKRTVQQELLCNGNILSNILLRFSGFVLFLCYSVSVAVNKAGETEHNVNFPANMQN